MGRVAWLGLIAGMAIGGPVAAQDPAPVPRIYTRSIDLTSRLYLYKDKIAAAEMMRSAVELLESRIDWLFGDIDGNTVVLRHGNGNELVRVEFTGFDDLPRALFSMEQAILSSGYDTGSTDVRLSLASGGFLALDNYSRVLSGDSLQRFDTRLKGTLVGVGATLRIVNEALTIVSVIPDGPADRAGIRPGDVIERIDDSSTVSMPVNEAVKRIRGTAGSKVQLHLRRTVEDTTEMLSPVMVRAKVILPNVEHELLAGDVGYIRITNVSQKTVYNLKRAMMSLRDQGGLSQGVVLDLRGNTGGSMKESSGSVDQFVERGVVLTTAGPDGEPVPQLLSKLTAVDAGDEPEVPVVVLVDHRTASGAEIISGSLKMLERAALVGTRTFGKGEVQKIYDLDGESRLKLTVAEYLLAKETHVAGIGIVPDVTLGRVLLDEKGARLVGFDVERERKPFEDMVAWLDEREGWRSDEAPERDDVALELARRAVLKAAGPDRQAVLVAVKAVSEEVRAEQATLVADALAHMEIDWSPAAYPGSRPEAVVRIKSVPDPDDPDVQVLTVELENQGPSTLYRTVVELNCESFKGWDNLMVPLGKVESGGTSEGVLRMRLRPGVHPRADLVDVRVRADRRPALDVAPQVLHTESPLDPQLTVTAVLAGAGTERSVELVVHNQDDTTILEGLEASFRYPKVEGVELLSEGTRAAEVGPGAKTELALPLRLTDEDLGYIPLELKLLTDRHGTLARWDFELPVTGKQIVLEAPQIELRRHKTIQKLGSSSLPLVVTDNSQVQTVTVFVNDEKVLWREGNNDKLVVDPNFEVDIGDNEVRVLARDEDGLTTVRYFHILGRD